jgi:hypothetical protein
MAERITTEDLYLRGMIAKAETLTLLRLIDAIANKIGYQDPDGLPVVERFLKQRPIELEGLFGELETKDPAFAAKIYARYEPIKKSYSGEGSAGQG